MIANFFNETWAILSGRTKKHSAKRLALIALLVVAIFLTCGYYSALTLKLWADKTTENVTGLPLAVSWYVIAGSMAVLLAFIGAQIVNRAFGAFIDDTNCMTLARFQLVCWTVLIISAWLTMALSRVFSGEPDALIVNIPKECWQLLGIAAASTTGRELIVASKKTVPMPNNAPATKNTADALTAANDPIPAATIDANRQGTIFRNATPADASLADLFQGDEVGNAAHVDMTKVQMFFFTIAALVAYAAEIYASLNGANAAQDLKELPKIAPGLLLILTISHATYLTNKSFNHTPST